MPLWGSETRSIVIMRVEIKKLTPPEAEMSAYAFLDSLPIAIVYAPETKLRARELALRLRLNRVYDATYLALTLEESAQFWTADERFYNLVAPSFSAIKFLGHWNSGDPFV